MKIFYKNQCFNLIPTVKLEFCEGCYFRDWSNCHAFPLLTLVCDITEKKFKLELKKDIFEL